MEQVILELEEYLDKKRMGYDIDFPSLETLKDWLKDLKEAQNKMWELRTELQND